MSDYDDGKTLDKTNAFVSDTLRVRLDRARQAPPSIVVLIGPSQYVGRQYSIKKASVVIGRDIKTDILIQDLSVSKLHARLNLDKGVVSIADLNSTNKTIVNTKELATGKVIELANNDRIKLGNVIFKFLEKGSIESVSILETYDRSLKDSLTEIYNKGAFENKAKEFFERAELLGTDLGLITFDLDHFKKINDQYGHSAGDYVLKSTVSYIRDGVIRNNDIFARTGGEEFCILLLGSSFAQSQEVAKRVRETIESSEYQFAGHSIQVSVSVGMSAKVSKDKSWLSIFERADKALYKAKNAGRNQVQFL